MVFWYFQVNLFYSEMISKMQILFEKLDIVKLTMQEFLYEINTFKIEDSFSY